MKKLFFMLSMFLFCSPTYANPHDDYVPGEFAAPLIDISRDQFQAICYYRVHNNAVAYAIFAKACPEVLAVFKGSQDKVLYRILGTTTRGYLKVYHPGQPRPQIQRNNFASISAKRPRPNIDPKNIIASSDDKGNVTLYENGVPKKTYNVADATHQTSTSSQENPAGATGTAVQGLMKLYQHYKNKD